MPRLRDVALEHLRVTGLGLRPAIIGALVTALVALGVAVLQGVGVGTSVYLHAEPPMLPGLMGALLPFIIWGRDTRTDLDFLWVLPVNRGRHALVRVFTGWMWLMAGVGLFALWVLTLVLMSGSSVLPVETLHVLTGGVSALGPLDPAALQSVRWAPGPQIWAVPFVAATATYLLGSALTLGTRHPFRWIAAGMLSVGLIAVVGDAAGTLPAAGWVSRVPLQLLRSLVSGPRGLDALLTARTASLDSTAILTSGARVNVWSAAPRMADWRTAALLWNSAGLLALSAAIHGHRERRGG
ncbi:MAG: hypothetical protein JWO05_778 [Gemmatimonadetes bacterium]|nr:hypothetical protein [Gemmatimonadota bacterium]